MTPSSPAPKVRQRLMIFVLGFLFLGSSLVVLVGLLFNPPKPPTAPTTKPEAAAGDRPSPDQLRNQVKTYEGILAQEPKNIYALEGLAATYLQLEDLGGATQTLERLVILEPTNERYTSTLKMLKAEQDRRQKNQQTPGSPGPKAKP